MHTLRSPFFALASLAVFFGSPAPVFAQGQPFSPHAFDRSRLPEALRNVPLPCPP